MRELRHTDPLACLPPRMMEQADEPRRAAPMDHEELRRIATDCFRVQGEIDRQTRRFGPAWAEHAHYLAESYNGLIFALLTIDEDAA